MLLIEVEFGWVAGGGGVVGWWSGGGVQSHNRVKSNSVELS